MNIHDLLVKKKINWTYAVKLNKSVGRKMVGLLAEVIRPKAFSPLY